VATSTVSAASNPDAKACTAALIRAVAAPNIAHRSYEGV
jgi:hypothetical protein